MPVGDGFRREVIFLGFVSSDYSRSSTLLKSESREIKKTYIELQSGFRSYTRQIIKLRKKLRGATCLVVMSPCHVLTPILRFFVGGRLILDAGWPLSDGVISRKVNTRNFLHFLSIYFLDFIAIHSADKVFLESNAQLSRVQKKFKVSKKKLIKVPTGLDENTFSVPTNTSELILDTARIIHKKNLTHTVIFRGKINNEAGLENMLSAAYILRAKALFIFVVGKDDLNFELGENIIRFSELSYTDIVGLYNLSDVALGQLSINPRLRYTIPHKAYEAAFLGIPYITTRSPGVMELLGANSAIYLDNPTGATIAEAIDTLDSQRTLELINNMKSDYRDHGSQQLINSIFEKTLTD